MDIGFCPECGSSVFWNLEKFLDKLGVAGGAFADLSFPGTAVNLWTENTYHWVPLPEEEAGSDLLVRPTLGSRATYGQCRP